MIKNLMNAKTTFRILLLSIFAVMSANLHAKVGSKKFDVTTNKNYKSASFTMVWYSIGKAAVGSEPGVHDVSMLVRMKPFAEWITVYYDPKVITEKKILKLLHERRCKQSKLKRTESDKFTAMNPYVSPGEIIQLKIGDTTKKDGLQVTLPKGWKVTGDVNGVKHEDAKTYLSVLVPEKTELKKYNIGLILEDNKTFNTEVEIVRGIGR